MQLKELLQFNSITQPWRCFSEVKDHLWVGEDVVVVVGVVANVVGVVVRQENVFFGCCRQCQSCWPCWNVATANMHHSSATSHGKLARSYKCLNTYLHTRMVLSLLSFESENKKKLVKNEILVLMLTLMFVVTLTVSLTLF